MEGRAGHLNRKKRRRCVGYYENLKWTLDKVNPRKMQNGFNDFPRLRKTILFTMFLT